jgi:hypothetical protein
VHFDIFWKSEMLQRRIGRLLRVYEPVSCRSRWNSGLTGPTGSREELTEADQSSVSKGNSTSSQEESTTVVAHRGKKLPPPRQDYIILGARKARMLPRFKPMAKNLSNVKIKVDELDEQRKQLLVFTTKASMETILDNIDRMKPLINTLSPKRYEQLMLDLKRSFAVPQLRAYIRSKSDMLKSSGPKAELLNAILKNLWKVSVSDSVSESSDVIIEKTIQLSRRELFIIVSQNGRIPRSWTKSGARIVILGDEQKIVVRSTADTYDWILASLHKALQSIRSVDIDFSRVQPYTSIEKLPLNRIQRLSDTYLQYQESDNTLTASAKSNDLIDHAKRLIVHSTGYTPRTVNSYLYDINPENVSRCALSRIIDDDAIAWNERSREWFRWKDVRRKLNEFPQQQPTRGEYQIASLPDLNNGNSIENAITDKLLENLDHVPANMRHTGTQQLTFTATYGYLLHESEPCAGRLPQCEIRTFSSNVPFLSQRCSQLSLFSGDQEPAVTGDSSPDDAWSKLLARSKTFASPEISYREEDSYREDEGEDVKGIRVNKDMALHDDHMHLVQLKLVPSPFANSVTGSQDVPPLELWLDVDQSDKCDLESVRLVSADMEANAFLSMPDKDADVKFTASKATFLDGSDPLLSAFLTKTQLDISGHKRIYVPSLVDLNIDGKTVTYMYQSLTYRRQIDLSYKGHILQLSILEGGGFGGRRLEANLVLDCPEGQADKDELNKFIQDALSFCESLRK